MENTVIYRPLINFKHDLEYTNNRKYLIVTFNENWILTPLESNIEQLRLLYTLLNFEHYLLATYTVHILVNKLIFYQTPKV